MKLRKQKIQGYLIVFLQLLPVLHMSTVLGHIKLCTRDGVAHSLGDFNRNKEIPVTADNQSRSFDLGKLQ